MLTGTYNATTGSLTVVIDGIVYSVDKSRHNYDLILESYKKQDSEMFVNLFNEKVKREEVLINSYELGDKLRIDGDKLFYNGREVHYSYATRIINAKKAGFPIDPMLKFFENLLQNTSSRSIEELPDFLMNKNLPLTEDGCFLAYKSVKSDFYSKASGKLQLVKGSSKNGFIYNGVGEVIECPRNEVDDERVHECSHGLHVGGLQYSGPGGWYNSLGDKVVVVKVNPKDVVSVPRDHDAQKVRVCKYEVLRLYEAPLNNHCEGVEKEVTTDIAISQLYQYDRIKFLYQGKNDTKPKMRFMIVEEIEDDYIFGTLLSQDPSYEEGNESRKFLVDHISKIVNLDDCCEDDEEFDDDYCECDDCECDY